MIYKPSIARSIIVHWDTHLIALTLPLAHTTILITSTALNISLDSIMFRVTGRRCISVNLEKIKKCLRVMLKNKACHIARQMAHKRPNGGRRCGSYALHLLEDHFSQPLITMGDWIIQVLRICLVFVWVLPREGAAGEPKESAVLCVRYRGLKPITQFA